MHRRNGGRLATGQRCRCRRSFSVRVLYLAHRNAERGSDSLSLHLGVIAVTLRSVQRPIFARRCSGCRSCRGCQLRPRGNCRRWW
jgi:hypothetical protein